jgi:hypothetical protein
MSATPSPVTEESDVFSQEQEDDNTQKTDIISPQSFDELPIEIQSFTERQAYLCVSKKKRNTLLTILFTDFLIRSLLLSILLR